MNASTPVSRRACLAVACALVVASTLATAAPSGAATLPPAAPTGVVADPGDGTAVVTWTAVTPPSGQAIVGYQVKVTKGKGCAFVPAPTLSCTLSKLRNGVTSTVEVRAVASKKGPWSVPVPVVAGSPLAPSAVKAVAGPSSATVSFAPGADNGSPVTAFHLIATDATTPANGGQVAQGAASPVLVSGLTNGDLYTFTVSETNARGTSGASPPSTGVTPDAVPGTPTGVSGAPGNDDVTVSFTAPPAPVTSYLVTATDTTSAGRGGQTAFGVASPIDVPGLTNGDSYTFVVTALNGTVGGQPSAPSAVVVPIGPPNLAADGSSLAGAAMGQWVGATGSLFGLNVNWQADSSVIGLNNFAVGQTDFAASDLPYSANQSTYVPNQPYQYLPDVGYGLAFAFHLHGTDGQPITGLHLDATVIDDIFLGRITEWNDPAIAGINPQLAGLLPPTQIVPVYRTDASGENYLLSSYLLDQDAATFTAAQNAFQTANPGQPSAVWPTPSPSANGTGYPAWAAGIPVGENGPDTAVGYVSELSSEGSITYVTPAYATFHDLPVAALRNASGAYVQPSAAAEAAALQWATLNPDLTADLTPVFADTTASSYALSGYSYLVTPCSPGLAADQGASCSGPTTPSPFAAARGAELGQFVDYLACAGQQHLDLLGYTPLTPNLVVADFAAIGRMNGGVQPAPPTAANCQNPYVDGQLPLPGP